MIGRTIRNGKGFERVTLTAEELDQVYQEVMEHNNAVIQDCFASIQKDFPNMEPARQVDLSLLLAEKACIHRFTAEKEALEQKISKIKDAANRSKGGNNSRSISEHVEQQRVEQLKPGEGQPYEMKENQNDSEEWPIISSYTTEQAEADGVLTKVGQLKSGEPVYFTTNLLSKGYEDMVRRVDLVTRGLKMLSRRDPEDTEYMRLRVVEKDKAWVIHEPGKLTYLAPEDY